MLSTALGTNAGMSVPMTVNVGVLGLETSTLLPAWHCSLSFISLGKCIE